MLRGRAGFPVGTVRRSGKSSAKRIDQSEAAASRGLLMSSKKPEELCSSGVKRLLAFRDLVKAVSECFRSRKQIGFGKHVCVLPIARFGIAIRTSE